MITTMNKRINSPIRQCPFPVYTPLDILPNSSTLACETVSKGLMVDKEFLKDQKEDNSASSIQTQQSKN